MPHLQNFAVTGKSTKDRASGARADQPGLALTLEVARAGLATIPRSLACLTMHQTGGLDLEHTLSRMGFSVVTGQGRI